MEVIKRLSEVKQLIREDDVYVIQQMTLTLDCCMCGEEKYFMAETKNEVIKLAEEAGWHQLNSEQYQLIGWYCGCDYLD